jgi:hypothetical protein
MQYMLSLGVKASYAVVKEQPWRKAACARPRSRAHAQGARLAARAVRGPVPLEEAPRDSEAPRLRAREAAEQQERKEAAHSVRQARRRHDDVDVVADLQPPPPVSARCSPTEVLVLGGQSVH